MMCVLESCCPVRCLGHTSLLSRALPPGPASSWGGPGSAGAHQGLRGPAPKLASPSSPRSRSLLLVVTHTQKFTVLSPCAP